MFKRWLFSRREAEFPSGTLPWPDRKDFERRLQTLLSRKEISQETAEDLRQWNREGYLIWRGAVDTVLIDELLEDYESGWRERPACNILMKGQGVKRWEEAVSRKDARPFRLLDFHNLSAAGLELLMLPRVLNFMKLIFGEKPVGLQTLFFEFGSEQGPHQDFAYVQTGILSHLAASWIACEDTDEANGPLVYYPGSHRIAKFDFGGGRITFDPRTDGPRHAAFERHLKEACEQRGLKRTVLHARKGDLLLWHAALVHGGSPVLDPARTRKSLVCHYTDVKAQPADWRSPGKAPKPREKNGGVYYEWQAPGHLEGRYSKRAKSAGLV